MIKVLVNGARGRMGQEAVQAIKADPELTLVGETDLGDDLVAQIKASKADVVVDFTVAGAGFENARKILEAGACPVIGTSGFNAQEVRNLQALAAEKRKGGVVAPNFSLGAVLMMKFAREAAAIFEKVEIVERHHDKKADSPSGTAVRTAELISEVRKSAAVNSEKESITGVRGGACHGVRIHSQRLPGIVAEQEVTFGGEGETLRIEHRSIDRKCFMPGVCLACKQVLKRTELYYGLEHLL